MNVYQRILKYGHDEDFIPAECPEPTDAFPGSPAKVEILAKRVLAGVSLFHEDDRDDYEGAVGGFREHKEPKTVTAPAVRVYDNRLINRGTKKGKPN